MTISSYYVKLKDVSGNQVAVFAGSGRGGAGGDMKSLGYTKRLRYPGEFSIAIDGNDERIPLFAEDCQAEFYRRDVAGGLGWYKDFEGFVRSFEFNQDDSGRDTFVARGRGYNDLLLSETINYRAGTVQTQKSGPSETVLKSFVDENIGPSAGLDSLGLSRVRPGLAIQASAGTGAVWTGQRSSKLLFDICLELAEYGPGDFMIVGTGPAVFEFQWKINQWGLDKTIGNAGGIPPVVFGSQYGNATNLRYSLSHLEEANVVYVLGQGVGTARANVTVADTTAVSASPWARRAVSRSATSESTASSLVSAGYDTLNKQKTRAKILFDARQTYATRYGRDWDYGDLVTVVFTKTGLTRNLKVTGVRVSVGDNGVESIVPEVEDA